MSSHRAGKTTSVEGFLLGCLPNRVLPQTGRLIHEQLIDDTMRKTILAPEKMFGLILAFLVCVNCDSLAQTPADAPQIQTSELDQQVLGFLQREVTAHVSDIKTLDPPPDHVVGALTTGEFSWGTFMRTLGAYSEFAGTKTIAGHDVAQMIRKMAQIELSHGGKTWAQLYAAMALESFGKDLKHNALWQGGLRPLATNSASTKIAPLWMTC